MLTRRQLLAALGAGTVLGAGCRRGGGAGFDGAAGPNVLLVMPDEWRAQALSSRGNGNLRTPVVDALGEGGAAFERAFANVPQCSPNRSTLLTGRFPHATGVLTNDLPIRSDVRGLAQVLTEAGWDCGYIGKWHLDGWPRDRFTPPGPRRLGFDGYWAAANGAHDYFDGQYYEDGPQPLIAAGWEPEHQLELAARWLEREGSGRPKFTVLSWGPPHAPYLDLPPQHLKRAAQKRVTLRDNVAADGAPLVDLALYYAACEALDDLLGQLLQRLAEGGLLEDTLVVVTSDHGSMLGSHGLSGKQTPFEEAIAVPLVFHQPGRIPAGARPGALFSALDLAPTLCGLLGVPPDSGFQGTDLSRAVLGEAVEGPSSVYLGDLLGLGRSFTQGVYTWRGVRTERFVYAEDGVGPWVLYDLENDPFQLTNLVGDPARAGERETLSREIASWAERLGDPRLGARGQARAAGVSDELDQLVARLDAELGTDTEVAEALERYLTDATPLRNRAF